MTRDYIYNNFSKYNIIEILSELRLQREDNCSKCSRHVVNFLSTQTRKTKSVKSLLLEENYNSETFLQVPVILDNIHLLQTDSLSHDRGIQYLLFKIN